MKEHELRIAACYIRVSTDKQEELSPASQLKAIKKFAKDNGYILTEEYIFIESEGVSGRKAENREAFQRMIATAKTKPKPFDAILVWKFSRFSRNIDQATFYKSMLRKKLGIDVISCSEPMMEGMHGRLVEMMIEWSDEYYSVNLSGEVMRGMTEKAIRGGYQSTIPYGYRMNKDTKIPEIYPEEAEVVKVIFSMAADIKNSYYDICKYLNDANIKTKRGNRWELRTVKYILENPFYIGNIRWNRQHHETHTIKDPSEWIISKAAHKAIISEEEYNNVQDAMRQRAARHKTKARPASTKHWLSGLIKCSNCGYSLFLGCVDKNGMHSLQCGNYQKGKCNVSHSITEAKIVEGLTAALNSMLESSDPLSYNIINKSVDNSFERSLYDNALAKLKQKEKRIKQAYMDGIDSIEEYKENKQLIQDEREKLQLKYNNINKEPVVQNSQEIKEVIKNVIDIINSPKASAQEKHDAIRCIIDYAIFIKSENRIKLHLIQYT